MLGTFHPSHTVHPQAKLHAEENQPLLFVSTITSILKSHIIQIEGCMMHNAERPKNADQSLGREAIHNLRNKMGNIRV